MNKNLINNIAIIYLIIRVEKTKVFFLKSEFQFENYKNIFLVIFKIIDKKKII